MTPGDVRKSVQDLILEDLFRSGLVSALVYDASNIPAWFLFGGTDDEFIERSYRLILNRPPSSADISHHKGVLSAGTLSRAKWVLGVADSPESMADANPAMAHVRRLASAELAWQSVLASAELDRRNAVDLGGGTDDEFIELSYKLILNRSPSPTDIADHKAALAEGTLSRAEWLLGVADSPELMASANPAMAHVRRLASAELAWQRALASAELNKQSAFAPLIRSPFSRILSKLKSIASFGAARQPQTLREGMNDIRTNSVAQLSHIASELQTLRSALADHLSLTREGVNDVRATSADHLSLIGSELQTLREGLSDVLRTAYHNYRVRRCYNGGDTPFPVRSSHSPADLPEAVRRRELNLTKQRILTELDRRYRGSDEALKAQLEFYLPHIEEIRGLGPVIDVGCGRGIFLEKMRDHQIDAIGLEINEDHIEECRRNKLDVRQIDALEFMHRSEANKWGAITLFHVIEHLDFDALVAVLTAAYRVLAPGGIVLMETPNSENLYVSTYMFNVDPTHVKPITYQYISTVLDVLGFECERLPVSASLHDDDGGQTSNRHLNYLLSVSANLSVVARKPRFDS